MPAGDQLVYGIGHFVVVDLVVVNWGVLAARFVNHSIAFAKVCILASKAVGGHANILDMEKETQGITRINQ